MRSLERPFVEQQDAIRAVLSERGVDDKVTEQAVSDGYVYTDIVNPWSGDTTPGVMDAYYGRKPSGLIPLDVFVSVLGGEPVSVPPSRTVHYSVRSLAEAEQILATPRHARFRDRMSFRGQTAEYPLRRSIPTRSPTNWARVTP